LGVERIQDKFYYSLTTEHLTLKNQHVQRMNSPIGFWNARYAKTRFVYGTKPNEWLVSCLAKLESGSLLLPAEGEGRNAVYASKFGWKVDAIDFSESAKAKALQLAKAEKVSLFSYEIGDLSTFVFKREFYEAVGLVYVHIPSEWRKVFHQKIEQSLKLGGRIILEAFDKSQLGNNSGGPKNIDQLYDLAEIMQDFESIDWLHSEHNGSHKLKEGDGHNGNASIIRLFGVKTDA